MATALPIADKATLDAIKAIIDERLDKKISAISGGIDWSNKTFQISCPSGTAETNTHLSITGSGYLVNLFCAYATSSNNNSSFSVQIDGGPIFVITFVNKSGAIPSPKMMFPIRFKNSLLIKANSAPSSKFNTWVVLD